MCNDPPDVPEPVQEQICATIEQNGGTMWLWELKQSVSWSGAFVSIATQTMARDGALVRFGIAEHTRVYLPDEVPEPVRELLDQETIERLEGGGSL